jgi:hypothetical protein
MPATAVTVNNLPVVLGQALMANSLAVTIASDQSPLAVTNPNLDVALSTLNREVTQLLIQALLTTIDGDTSNLDVLLSTRASETTLAAGIGALLAALGPKSTTADIAAVVAALGPKATEATLLTRATEATLLTRLSKADFEARINTLGQKLMAASTPVVIASDQSAIEVKGTTAVGSAPTNPPLSVSGVNITTGFKEHIPLVVVNAAQAVRTTIVGISRTPSLVLVPVNTAVSNTTAGVQEVSIRVIAGANAQIGGVAVPNGTSVTYRANPGDTIGAISYQTGAGTRMLISYII